MAIENSGDGNGNGIDNDRVDTLLPAHFQLVRSERVAGLNVRPSKYATQLGDEQPVADEAGLRVFPSLYPNRRFEVKQLDRTFERMIDELGIRLGFNTVRVTTCVTAQKLKLYSIDALKPPLITTQEWHYRYLFKVQILGFCIKMR